MALPINIFKISVKPVVLKLRLYKEFLGKYMDTKLLVNVNAVV